MFLHLLVNLLLFSFKKIKKAVLVPCSRQKLLYTLFVTLSSLLQNLTRSPVHAINQSHSNISHDSQSNSLFSNFFILMHSLSMKAVARDTSLFSRITLHVWLWATIYVIDSALIKVHTKWRPLKRAPCEYFNYLTVTGFYNVGLWPLEIQMN